MPPACITPNVDGKVSESKLKKLCPPTFGPYQRELSPRHISQKHASKTSNMACMNSYAMISSWYSLDACFWGPAFASDDSLYFTDAALLLWQCSSGMRVSLFLAAKFISSAESSVGKWCSYFETWRFLWNKMRTWHFGDNSVQCTKLIWFWPCLHGALSLSERLDTLSWYMQYDVESKALSQWIKSKEAAPVLFRTLHGIKAAGSKRLSHSVFSLKEQREERVERIVISRRFMNFTD